MGQKVNPVGFRTGIYRPWDSRWFARHDYDYAKFLQDDIKVRNYIEKRLPRAEIGRIEIERAGDSMRILIHSARPGVVIGRKGQEIDFIRRTLADLLGLGSVDLSVHEIKKPELSANVMVQGIVEQLERRAHFKKIAKKFSMSAMRAGAKGVKIRIAGRLGGAEIARGEWIRMGSVPLHTLRADIDYAAREAHTTYGIIGVQIWICRG